MRYFDLSDIIEVDSFIFFGEVDTASEMKSAPSEDYLAKNYYDLNDISTKFGTKSNIEIITGGKDTGKTSLIVWFTASKQNPSKSYLGKML